MKKVFNSRNIVIFIFITFLFSILYTSLRIAIAPVVAPDSDSMVRVKSDYVFMLVSCVAGALAMLLPGFLVRKVNLNIPSFMIVVYALFVYCAIYLGEVRNFYYAIPHWDTILHTFSGVALGALGFSIFSLLNKTETVGFTLSPVFVALFAFCFAVTIGVIWETIEFAIDYFLNTNMQRFARATGELLMGQAALIDTMKDLLVDSLGAFVISTVGYVSLKYDSSWLERFHICRNSDCERMSWAA